MSGLTEPSTQERRTRYAETPGNIGGFGDPDASSYGKLEALCWFDQLKRLLVEGQAVE